MVTRRGDSGGSGPDVLGRDILEHTLNQCALVRFDSAMGRRKDSSHVKGVTSRSRVGGQPREGSRRQE